MTAMRLQRALARAGVASRRASEDLIRAGKVKVNGRTATIGLVVVPGQDEITVSGHRMQSTAQATVILHKPLKYIVSRRDPGGRKSIFELVPEIPGLSYVGRLDVMTSGLLLLTTDGDLNERLTHPRYHVPRRYQVTVRGGSPEQIRDALGEPLRIGGRAVQVDAVRVRGKSSGRSDVSLTLYEGRNRIVRRICAELGLEVERLVRTSHGPIRLGRLGPGEWRYVTADERRSLRRLVGRRAG